MAVLQHVEDTPDALRTVYQLAFLGLQAVIDASVIAYRQAHTDNVPLGDIKWHEQFVNEIPVCSLMHGETVLLQWALDPHRLTSQCLWKRPLLH